MFRVTATHRATGNWYRWPFRTLPDERWVWTQIKHLDRGDPAEFEVRAEKYDPASDGWVADQPETDRLERTRPGS
jgi:hypothetical protein